MALDTLRTNKLRSGLTVLGVFIAIITVLSVVAILMGFDKNIQDQMQSFGPNNVFFFHLNPGVTVGRRSREERMRKPLLLEHYRAVKEACTACDAVTASIIRRGFGRARYKGEEIVGLDFQGAMESFFTVYGNAVIETGRAFTKGEDEHRSAVAVIGHDLAEGLFGKLDPIGKEVIINGQVFRIIGVLEKPPGGGIGPQEDKRVLVPYGTFHKIYPRQDWHLIVIQAKPGKMALATDQTRTALRVARRVKLDKPDDFGFATADSIIEQFRDLVGVVALVIAVIASVGLMIGGVGVMNIMLVSVTERTREIGVRKAIGARRRDIVWQFLTEAMTLTAVAGVAGVLCAEALSALIRNTVPNLPTFIPVWVVILAVSVSASIGLFFGMYPAVKAARLDPVDALRHE